MSRLLLFFTIVTPLTICLGSAVFAQAQDASSFCRAHRDDRFERLAPEILLSRLGQAFDVAPDGLRGTSYVRCAGGQLLGCMVGANLNCGHANVSRRSQGGDAFCHDKPNSTVIPMSATGHASIYEWRCVGAFALVGQSLESVDRLGFMSRNWRPLR